MPVNQCTIFYALQKANPYQFKINRNIILSRWLAIIKEFLEVKFVTFNYDFIFHFNSSPRCPGSRDLRFASTSSGEFKFKKSFASFKKEIILKECDLEDETPDPLKA